MGIDVVDLPLNLTVTFDVDDVVGEAVDLIGFVYILKTIFLQPKTQSLCSVKKSQKKNSNHSQVATLALV